MHKLPSYVERTPRVLIDRWKQLGFFMETGGAGDDESLSNLEALGENKASFSKMDEFICLGGSEGRWS